MRSTPSFAIPMAQMKQLLRFPLRASCPVQIRYEVANLLAISTQLVLVTTIFVSPLIRDLTDEYLRNTTRGGAHKIISVISNIRAVIHAAPVTSRNAGGDQTTTNANITIRIIEAGLLLPT